MKVIILAGGFGTRLAEYTDVIPKPMVRIGGKPILWHIMNIYSYFGHKDFFVAVGYKSEVIKEYFLNFSQLQSDFAVNLSSGELKMLKKIDLEWNVHLIETGKKSMTGGRVKRMQKFIGQDTCLLTYGDGLSDINIKSLIKFHKSHGKFVTMTAVRPVARFGELEIEGDKVTSFKEKPQLENSWINGGFFVIEPEFFDYISGDQTLLEREPLELAAENNQLMAYKHEGFWQCMDSKRDHETLEMLWENDKAPWKRN